MDLKTWCIYLCKGVRSFFSGTICALTIYFYYRDVSYEDPIRMPLSMACMLFFAALKSALLTRYRQTLGHLNTLILTYLLQLLPLILANDVNLGTNGTARTYSFYLSIGLFPIDGEDLTAFERIEKAFLRKAKRQKEINCERLYDRLGYVCQALGSLALGGYFFMAMYEDFDEKLKVHWVLQALCILIILCVLLSYSLCRGNGKQIFSSLAFEQANTSPQQVVGRSQLRLHSFLEGIGCGLLSAPYIAYYCELKLDYYYDQVGEILAVFFLLKGFGFDFVSKVFSRYPRYIRGISITCNVLIALVAFFPTPKATTILLTIAFPLWHLGRAQINLLAGTMEDSMARDGLKTQIWFWEKVGAASGILAASFSFHILYYKAIFAYPFVLCALIRLINQHYMFKLDINHVDDGLALKTDEESSELETPAASSQKVTEELVVQEPNEGSYEVRRQSNAHKYCEPDSLGRKCLRYALLVGIAALLVFFYFNTFKDDVGIKGFKLMYPRLSYDRPKELRYFNVSLEEYLVKQNITKLQLAKCDSACVQGYRKKYQSMEINPANPEWLHFPQSPYFTSEGQIADYFASLNNITAAIRGFSVFWKQADRYNKITEQLRNYIKLLPESHGFFYNQMPSLNLRGVQSKIVLIFTRERRIPVSLPKFVSRPPPKNYIGFTTTFKMVLNLAELREFIIYHLRMGIDKFFLYDNDPPNEDTTLFDGIRVSGVLRRCPRFNSTKKQQIIQELWEQFYDHIIYVPWRTTQSSPLVEEHSQNQGYQHYGYYFKQAVKYTVFTDMDEYILSRSGKTLSDSLKEMQQRHNLGTLYIQGRSFQYHTCNPGKLLIEQTKWVKLPYKRLTIKVVIMNKLMVRPGCHGRESKNGNHAFIGSPWHDLMFNHYQITTPHLRLINLPVPRYEIDETLLPLVDGLKQSCNGKCTDSFEYGCPREELEQMLKELCSTWP